MLEEPDDIWIRGSEARRQFNLTREDLQELGENYIIKANPFDAEKAPFKQYSLKEVVALAKSKHSEQHLFEHFDQKFHKWKARSESDFSRKLYGHEPPEEELDTAPSSLRTVRAEKRYWYNAPSTTTTEGVQSVMQGLRTNSCICLVKGGVWFVTGSHAMFADWMHSIADVANYSYRLMELNRSARKRDLQHPYGYAPLRYITADRSFVFLFFVGGVMPLGLGIQELWEAFHVGTKVGDHLILPASVFIVSAALEGAAVRAAYSEILSQAQREQIGAESKRPDNLLVTGRKVLKYVREGRDVMSTATFTEAFSGMLSSAVGLVGLGLSYHLQSGTPDVVASICMATIVSGVSVFLLQKSGNALLGETLPRWRVKALIDKLEAHVAVVNVYDVKTELVGVDTVRFKAEVQFNPQSITERILRLNTADEEPDPSGMEVHLAHAVLASQLQDSLPQLRRGFQTAAAGDDPATAWLFRNNNLFYEALAWELKDAERVLRAELQDFKNVHIDLEPW